MYVSESVKSSHLSGTISTVNYFYVCYHSVGHNEELTTHDFIKSSLSFCPYNKNLKYSSLLGKHRVKWLHCNVIKYVAPFTQSHACEIRLQT